MKNSSPAVKIGDCLPAIECPTQTRPAARGHVGRAQGIAFLFFFQNPPSEHPSVNTAEKHLIEGDFVKSYLDEKPEVSRSTVGLISKGTRTVLVFAALMVYSHPIAFCWILFLVKFFGD